MKNPSSVAFLFLAGLVVTGCQTAVVQEGSPSGTSTLSDTSTSTSTTGREDPNTTGLALPDSGTVSTPGNPVTPPTPPTTSANCGSSASQMNQQPVEMLILMDRSSSMEWAIDSSEERPAPAGKQRWDMLKAGLRQVLTTSPKGILWGLKMFGAESEFKMDADWRKMGCEVGPGAEVGVAADTSSKIESTINSLKPGTGTPTRAAIEESVKYFQTVKTTYSKYILLATDGEPYCGGPDYSEPDLPATVEAIKAATTAGFKTYVIGIGPSLNNLNQMAVAGGTSAYFSATTADKLTTALQTIVTQIASCTYSIGSVPPDPENIGVYLDKHIVNKSAADGWTYTASGDGIIFNGSYCEKIKTGQHKLVEVLFGCKNEKPPVVIK